MNCLRDDDIADFVEGRLPDDPTRRAIDHLDRCTACRVLVAHAAEEAPPEPDAYAVGARLGRFVLLGPAGKGGMGSVYAAYDPDLDRKVALKVVRADLWGANLQARLRREAQAMARLNHPDVITVYEVGTVDDRLFIAMEFMDGGTLRAWLEAAPRGWREVVERFARAGDGLAAAHSVGIVHRDFKADNVLLGADHRQRVTDFGLARAAQGEEFDAASRATAPASTSTLDVALTRSGTLLGTPAYMAPEQIEHGAVDARADQFSFCASLYHALYGQLPFAGEGLIGYVDAVLHQRLRPAPPSPRIPARLRAVIVRGLAARPEDRHASVADLVRALRSCTRQRTGVALGAVAAATALLSVGALAMGVFAHHTPCAGAAQKLSGVWDAARRQAVRSAFVATGEPYARDVADRLEHILDRYAGAWVSARTDACEATRVRGEQSEALLDRRMTCFDRGLTELDAQVAVFSKSVDADLVQHAVEAAGRLPRLEACSDSQALLALVAPPDDPKVRAEVAAVGARIAEAKALFNSGRLQEAMKTAKSAAADPVAYAPVHAQALYQRARLEDEAGDEKAAQQTVEEALPIAGEAHDDLLVSQLWSQLVTVVGYHQGRAKDALPLLVAGDTALLRARSQPEAEAAWVTAKGVLFCQLGRNEDGRQLFERALAIDERIAAPPEVAASWIAGDMDRLGVVYSRLHQWDRSLEAGRRAVAMREQSLGPAHPKLADALNNLGHTLLKMGRVDEARPFFERALAIDEVALRGDQMRVARILESLGNIAYYEGRYEEALGLVERGLGIRQRLLGPAHATLRYDLATLSEVQRERGRYDEARTLAQQALAIGEKTPADAGSDDPAPALVAIADIDFAEGHHADARKGYERAVAIYEKVNGPKGVDLREPLTDLARVWRKLGRSREALAAGERALAIGEENPVGAGELADTRFALAQALEEVEPRSARAEGLAVQARDAFAGVGGSGKQKETREVEAWLAARGRATAAK